VQRAAERLDCGLSAEAAERRLLASGIPRFGERREVIHPSLWDDLSIAFPTSEISRGGVIYTKAEFFEPSEIPTNVPVPEWMTKAVEYFTLEGSDYRHVRAGGVLITLGDQQRRVIEFLHAKMIENEPWQSLRDIQNAANIKSRMRDAFHEDIHWSHLLKSDLKGAYRLRDSVDDPTTQTGPH
jgi:hypothetical protein